MIMIKLKLSVYIINQTVRHIGVRVVKVIELRFLIYDPVTLPLGKDPPVPIT